MTDGRLRDDELYSEPQVRFVTDVLEEIHRGELLIPRFQRPFVWPLEMRLVLFDSIVQRIPIGSIMVWQTNMRDVAIRDRLGPFRLPDAAPGHTRRYLLDGEQRIATLYFALYDVPEAPTNGDELPSEYRMYYDLEKGRFVVRSELRLPIPAKMLPLSDLLEGRRLTRFQRTLERLRSEVADDLIERADEVANSFRQYKLPVVTLRSESVELVTRTFQRVNTQQATMDEVHMVNALSWAEGFDLQERFESIREGKLEGAGWGDLEDLTILRVCKAAIGLDVYDQQPERLGQALRRDPDVLTKVQLALESTADFFRDNLNMGHLDLIPYTPQIIVIASAMFGVGELSSAALRVLGAWVWLTTCTESFQRQLNGTSFRQQIESVRSIVANTPSKFASSRFKEPAGFPKRFDPRSARSRGLTVLMWERRNEYVKSVDDFQKHELHAELYPPRSPVRETVAHLLSSQVAGPDLAANPGSRIVGDHLAAELVRLYCDYPASRPETDTFLQSHFIGSTAREYWTRKQWSLFVKERTRLLAEVEHVRFTDSKNTLEQWLGSDATS